MAHIQYIDELIREYMLFRGFTNTLRAFDADLKADKERGFRVDCIIDNFLQLISAYDLTGLRELWEHFEQRMFSRLDQEFAPAVKKLENSLLKIYVINALTNNKPEKISEFLSKMTSELQSQPEWKDWYIIPYMKNVEENQAFSLYFSKQWQDTALASLYNFLSVVYQAMPQPTLTSYEKETAKLRQLEEENESLKRRLSGSVSAQEKYENHAPDFIDDFYCLPKVSSAHVVDDNKVKSLTKLIRTTIGGAPSVSPSRSGKSEFYVPAVSKGQEKESSKPRLKSTSSSNPVLKVKNDSRRSISSDRELPAVVNLGDSLEKHKHPSHKILPFLLLSEESFYGHKTCVTQCRFNHSGSIVASTDVDGVVKIWSPAPSPVLQGSCWIKCNIRCLDWMGKSERYLVLGSEEGSLFLFDTKEFKTVWETENNSPLREAKISHVSCSPNEISFVCATQSTRKDTKLLIYDTKMKKLERNLILDCDPSVFVTHCVHNENGQLLLAGCSDGVIRMFDLRHSECVDKWDAHQDRVLCLQLSPDHNFCYSLGADSKLCRRSFNGHKGPTWDATLCADPLPTYPGLKFSLDQMGKHILMCYGQRGGGATVFKVTNSGLTSVLQLKGHDTPTVACDWATANQCCTCVTASMDGKICVSTLLMP